MKKCSKHVIVDDRKVRKLKDEEVSEKSHAIQCQYDASTQKIGHKVLDAAVRWIKGSCKIPNSIGNVDEEDVSNNSPRDC